jgi:cyclopropane fatty-acyl-phospholipid synthase-like methyltransferase
MNLLAQANIIKFHNDRSLNFYNDYQKLGWKSTTSQQLRFEVLASAFNLNGASVLDVGCGYADFKTFLDKKYSKVSYTGIDLNPAFVHEAARRFASDTWASFIMGDFYSVDLTSVDYIFSCGALNYRNPDPDYHFNMIKKMWNTANNGIAFTSLDEETFPKHSLLVGHNKDQIMDFCKKLSYQSTLISGYCPDDFAIIISK